MSRIFLDLTDQEFGRLTARWPVGKKKWGSIVWLCSCVCGKFAVTPSSNLVNANTMSCGCYRRETAASCISRRSFKHGQAVVGKESVEYRAYVNAKGRCTNVHNKDYLDYGGRGIKFLFNAFQEFFTELGSKPSHQHSLDRKDNDGNYEPGNVRWATKVEQRNNRRNLLKIAA